MKTNSISAALAVHARTIATTRHLIFRCACLWTGFLAFATIAFGPQPAQAAVTEAWVQRYGSEAGSADYAYKVVTDAAGNVIVAGSTSKQTGGADILIIKYSGAGVPLWTNRYNGPVDGYAIPTAVAVDGSGNVFVTESSGSSYVSGENYYESATIAYSGAGVPLWTNRYNGPGKDADTRNAVAVDGSGNVFVTGNSATIAYSGAGVPLWTNGGSGTAIALDGSGNVFVTGNSATIAYSGAGVPLWTNRYHGPANGYVNRATAVAVDPNGNVFVTGSSVIASGDRWDYATIAYSGAGVPLWTNRYNGPGNRSDEARALAVDGSGNVFVTGSSSFTDGSGRFDSVYATIAYSGAGVPLWTNRYNGTANSVATAVAVAVDASGNVFVTGSSVIASGDRWDYATIAYSGAGVPLWTNRYNGSASAVAVDASGNVFVTGSSYGSGGFDGDWATIAYSGAGAALWTNRYGGRRDAPDYAGAVAVDGSGNVFVTGSSVGSGGISDYETIAYSGAGVPLWTNRGPANGFCCQATAVAVDGSGNVFVTGSSATIAYSGAGAPLWTNGGSGTAIALDGSGNVFVTGSSGGDYYTAKYSGADGSVLWQQRYSGGWNQATAVAVDGSGNVFVTGSSYGSADNYDYATIAYSGAGVPLWTNRYDGPENRDDVASAVAVDGSGNVFVTGSSGSSFGFAGDYATIAYSGAGVPLWTNRYDGPGNGLDQANAVAVDASGNVVVTGRSSGTDTNTDYYTAKYAAADGALLWEKRYNGPANRFDSASAVGVDGSGNVVVTGRTDGFSVFGAITGGDYYTAKYAAADGATLWEKRFNRPLSGPGPFLALGPDGMIAVSGSSSDDFATVFYREVPTVSIDLIPTGVRLRFTGVSGRSYNIERAPAVTGPWSTINTQTALASGLVEYLDTITPHSGSGFYRIFKP